MRANYRISSCRHGDIIYVSYVEAQPPQQHQEADATNTEVSFNNVKQDEVDNFLEKQRGLIDRPKDQKL
jgi:nuclear protein localization family protein 4